MEDLTDNLARALARIWADYEAGGPALVRDQKIDAKILESLERIVHTSLSSFRKEVLGKYPDVKSILIDRLEESLIGPQALPWGHAVSMYFMPSAEDVELFRSGSSAGAWLARAKFAAQELLECKTFTAPAGTEIEQPKEPDQRTGVTSFTVRVPIDQLDPAARGRIRLPLLMPSFKSWDHDAALPEILAVMADEQSVPLPDVFGAPRGQWLYGAGGIRMRWWTEPVRPADAVIIAARSRDPATEDSDRPRGRWEGELARQGLVLVNRLDIELDLDAIQKTFVAHQVRMLAVQVRLPNLLAGHVYGDFARIDLGMEEGQMAKGHREIFTADFARYGAPGNWALVHERTQQLVEKISDTIITQPAQGERPAFTQAASSLVARRNIARAALRSQSMLVTAEDVSDAVDALLGAVGHVDRANVVGAPTWLEAESPNGLFARLRPRIGQFVGFVWVIPFEPVSSLQDLSRQVHSAMAYINRRVPIGVHAVIDVRPRGDA